MIAVTQPTVFSERERKMATPSAPPLAPPPAPSCTIRIRAMCTYVHMYIQCVYMYMYIQCVSLKQELCSYSM